MTDVEIVQLALIADGSSDEALLKPIEWAFTKLSPSSTLRRSIFRPRRPPGCKLSEFVNEVLADYAPDLLFVHRDAEAQDPSLRRLEIPSGDRIVPVVPVRMTEAWLLIEEQAIRRAAGNPNGRMPIELPRLQRLEGLSDPKKLLHDALVTASGFAGRRRQQFDRAAAARSVADYIEDYSKLRALTAFQEFERALSIAWAQVPR